VLTGQAGRHLRPSPAPTGSSTGELLRNNAPERLNVERLDAHGRVLSTQHLQVWEFLEHSLVEAQAAGPAVHPTGSPTRG